MHRWLLYLAETNSSVEMYRWRRRAGTFLCFKLNDNSDDFQKHVCWLLVKAMPWWSGAVSNEILVVEPTHVSLKVRVVNGVRLKSSGMSHISVDTEKHSEWLKPETWERQQFTMFVFCPFNTKRGGHTSGKGTMTFPAFYDSECSTDGRLCSFLSREGTVISRNETDHQAKFKGKSLFVTSHYIERFYRSIWRNRKSWANWVCRRTGWNLDLWDRHLTRASIASHC